VAFDCRNECSPRFPAVGPAKNIVAHYTARRAAARPVVAGRVILAHERSGEEMTRNGHSTAEGHPTGEICLGNGSNPTRKLVRRVHFEPTVMAGNRNQAARVAFSYAMHRYKSE
jgi:hypothetical protein